LSPRTLAVSSSLISTNTTTSTLATPTALILNKASGSSNGNNNGNGNTGNGNGNNNENGNGNGNYSHNNNCGTSSGNNGKIMATSTALQYYGPWRTITITTTIIIWGDEKKVKRDLDVGQATPTPDSQQLSSPAMQKSIGSTATLQSIPTQDSNSKTTETSLEPKSTNKVSASAETSKPKLINFQMVIYLGIAITDWVYYHLFD
ncbi:hypothetical protein G9A89_000923, partial [Geosiphon pyriformis]